MSERQSGQAAGDGGVEAGRMDPNWAPAVVRAVRAFGKVMGMLPARFVALHGDEVLLDFGQLAHVAHGAGGSVGLWALWLRASLDVMLRAPGERLREARVGATGVVMRSQSDWDGRVTPTGAGTGDDGTDERTTAAVAGGPRPPGSSGRVAPGGGAGGGGGGRWAFGPGDMVSGLRLAARSLLRRPGYAAVAALTLGLGIGANVAIFTIINRVLLQPLAYPGSDGLVVVQHHAPGLDLPELESSPGLIDFYQSEARSMTSLAWVGNGQVNLSGGSRPARVPAVMTGVEFFDVFATRPALGRAFVAEDVEDGAPPVVILMHDAWRTRFGSDPDIVGQRIEVNGQSTEVVGVMPEGFYYRDPSTVLLVATHLDVDLGFGTFGFRSIGRLAPGEDVASAQSEFDRLQTRLPEQFPELTPEFFQQAGWAVSVSGLRDLMVEDVRSALWLLLATVGIVLLIACANVANLFLVRAESRHRELAVRAALGASRLRVTMTILTESLLLGLVGSAFGMAMAAVGLRVLVARGPTTLPRLHEVAVDATSLGLAAVLGIVAGVVLGLLPSVRPLTSTLVAVLRDGARGSTTGRARHRLRKGLIAGQVALAVVLLVGSGLMLRSVFKLYGTEIGLEPDGVVTVGVSYGTGHGDGSPESDRAAARVFYDRVLEEVAALPGVQVAGATNALPLDPRGMNGGSFAIESQPIEDDALPPVATWLVATPGFFEALRVPLLEGRTPVRSDHTGGMPVAWVNETFARTFLDSEALGERIQIGGDSTWYEIVGVMGDVHTFGIREDVRPTIYFPMTFALRAVSYDMLQFVVRGGTASSVLLPAVRAAVERVDPDVPVTTARTMDEIVAQSLSDVSFTMTLLAIAAGVALLLGAIGLYGVISYVVTQRTQEIGVRLALGARPSDVRTMVVRQGIVVTLVGIAIGTAAAVAATSLIASMLYGVSARDPVTFGGVIILLLLVSATAAWLPARRAAAIDPVAALRGE